MAVVVKRGAMDTGKSRRMLLWHEVDENGEVNPTPDTAPSTLDSPKTKRKKIVEMSEAAGGPRLIASQDDLDLMEVQICLSILSAGLKAIFPQAQPTSTMLEAFLTAVFDGWTSATIVGKIEELKKPPIDRLDNCRWHAAEAPVILVSRTNKKGNTVKHRLTNVVELQCDPLSLRTSLCFVDNENHLKMSKGVKPTDLMKARWVSDLTKVEAGNKLHEVVLTAIVAELARSHEASAVHQARRALFQRSRGMDHFQLDPRQPFFSINKIFIALPQLTGVAVPVLSSVEFFKAVEPSPEKGFEATPSTIKQEKV